MLNLNQKNYSVNKGWRIRDTWLLKLLRVRGDWLLNSNKTFIFPSDTEKIVEERKEVMYEFEDRKDCKMVSFGTDTSNANVNA